LLNLINDVLDFSRIEAGRLELDSTRFDLSGNLEETARSFALRAHNKGLELICDIHSDVPDYITGDPVRLRQIVVNLLGNAIKFTQQGEVVLGATVDVRTADHALVHFTGKDTGIGISKERQGIIFEAFTQTDGATTRKFGGTGLGLTISTRLVEAMQGKLWVEIEPGRGSCFHFTAALTLTPQRASRRTGPEPSLVGIPVLIVDRNLTNRRILVDMTSLWQMRPVVALNGQEALSCLARAAVMGEPFSLVLADGNIPGIDGFGLAERIQAARYPVDQVIMMLASGDVRRCRELGTAGYLIKPVRRDELRAAIISARTVRPTEREKDSVVVVVQAGTSPRSSVLCEPGTLRILLAEDNIVNRLVAVRILEKAGYCVVMANNGVEAVATAAEQEFDLILMGIQMPEMDGFAATTAIRLREMHGGDHIPIVAMAAHAMKGDEARCLAGGMDGYISKPIRARDLIEIVEQHVT
jgi:two-component system sensor histidine kinase/response regulator